MTRLQYIPTHQLNTNHIGKPMKLQLKNGKQIYGTIKEIRRHGILFIPVRNKQTKTSNHAKTSILPIILFPIFIPFIFFVPFLIF